MKRSIVSLTLVSAVILGVVIFTVAQTQDKNEPRG